MVFPHDYGQLVTRAAERAWTLSCRARATVSFEVVCVNLALWDVRESQAFKSVLPDNLELPADAILSLVARYNISTFSAAGRGRRAAGVVKVDAKAVRASCS